MGLVALEQLLNSENSWQVHLGACIWMMDVFWKVGINADAV